MSSKPTRGGVSRGRVNCEGEGDGEGRRKRSRFLTLSVPGGRTALPTPEVLVGVVLAAVRADASSRQRRWSFPAFTTSRKH